MLRPVAVVLTTWFVVCLTLAGCGENGEGGNGQTVTAISGTKVLFDLSEEADFYDFPFPADVRQKGDGVGLDLSNYPRKSSRLLPNLMNGYVRIASKCKGFGLSSVIYFRFEAPLDASSLPSLPWDCTAEGSLVFLVDVDPSSREFGRRFPLRVRFYAEPGDLRPENVLALTPLPGFVLRPNTRYGALVLRSLGNAEGEPLGSPLALQRLLQGLSPGGPQGPRVQQAFEPLAAFLEASDIPPTSIAAATVFTTGNPVGDTERIYDHVASLPAPTPSSPLVRTREYDDYYVLESTFNAPQFQRGTPPYAFGEGEIVFDPSGRPQAQRNEEIPFALAIPKGLMPAEGWPLVIYIHGTGGVSTQMVDRGRQPSPDQSPEEGTGPALTFAARGIATAGSALPVHPQRTGLFEGLDFYNVLRPPALRDNMRQAMAEQALFLRVLRELTIDPLLCPDTDSSAVPDSLIRFDSNHTFSMGQSLGSMVLDLWAAFEEHLVAVIPSGTGGHFSTSGLEMRGIPFLTILGLIADIPADEEIDVFHPILNLIMLGWGSADSVNFAHHYCLEPLPGRDAKHVFVSQGFFDSYYPPPAQNAFIIASGLQLAGEPYDPNDFDEVALRYAYDSPRCGLAVPCCESTLETMDLLGHDVANYPVAGNLASMDGTKVTGVVVQALEDGILDGHHINFQLDGLKYQYGCFLRTLIDTGMPMLLEPNEISASCEVPPAL
jgi:hypothetical protein